MNKFNFQNPIFIITLVAFLTAVIVSVFLVWPKFEKLEAKRREIVNKQQEIQESRKIFSAIQKDIKKIEEYQEQLNIINFALPDNAEASLPSLFRFIQTASAKAGLFLIEIGAFTIIPPEQGTTIEKTQFNFQVSGSYTSLKAFLERLEKSVRIIDVENISFSSPEEESFTFNLGIKTYNYKKPDVFLIEEIKIDKLLNILRQPIFENLELFPEIILEEMGRENPFIPF